MSLIKTALGVALFAAFSTGAMAQKASSPGGSKTTVPAPLMFVDSVGKVVGRATSTGGVAINYNGNVLVFGLGPSLRDATGGIYSGLQWNGDGLSYSDPDCTGAAYMSITYGTRYASRAVKVGNQWIAHISAPGAVARDTYTQLSFRNSTGICTNGTFTTNHVMPVETTFSLDAYGIPPFYIQ